MELFTTMIQLINKKNFKLAFNYIKKMDFAPLYNKVRNKLQLSKISKLKQDRQMYINDFLRQDRKTIEYSGCVDIVVPIYNSCNYLKKCLASVYANTDMNYNLFLINDGSPDVDVESYLKKIAHADKPIHMQKLQIIKNETNLGFIQTVNKGMMMSKNHVVLLNTDTEVPPDWLSRLIDPILNNNNIASVTPFSNSATICSFPNFCQNNNLYRGLDCNSLDEYFKLYGSVKPVEIPTGVGFCMALNRKVLDHTGYFDAVTYGKGYGEENDWCMRAATAKFKNVMIPNLFVFHKHGVSFAEQKDKSKEERLTENLRKLNERYPKYDFLVQKFIAKDVLQSQRNFMRMLIDAKESKLSGTMNFNHSMGGGATAYLKQRILDTRKYTRNYILEMQNDMQTAVLMDCEADNEVAINMRTIGEKEFRQLLDILKVSKIFVNQLVSFPLKKTIDLIMKSKRGYIYFVHDYFSVCHNYILLLKSGKTCTKQVTNENWWTKCVSCKECGSDIQTWRDMFSEFLSNAQLVVAPSATAEKIIADVYPHVKIEVKQHKALHELTKTFRPEFLKQRPLILGVIGAIGWQKGARVIDDLVNIIRKENLPIKIKIIGYTDLHAKAYCSIDGILEITGPYDNSKISFLLEQYKVGLVLIPSIWPETFSYTAEETIKSGYPIMAFNLGAPAERIDESNGWIVNDISAQAVLLMLKNAIKKS